MDYNDILLLKDLLEKEDIPFDFYNLYDGYVIAYPSRDGCVCSILEHNYSYGSSSDLLEIGGILARGSDDVEGYLTALDVYGRIQDHWIKNKDIMKGMGVI